MRHNNGNPAIVIPTGGGKSPVMAAMARQVAEAGGRVCVAAHTKELVSQNHDKLSRLWPEAPAGIYSASMRRRDRFDQILFCQIQSVANKAPQLGRFDLLLIDEAHRIPLKGDGMYLTFIKECRRFNPGLKVIGLTATPYRLQGSAVPVCGPDNVLTKIAYEAKLTDLINDGYLSRLISKAGRAQADLSAVKVRGGDYVEDQLAAAMDRPELVDMACHEIVELAADRKAWIIFCVNVQHAEHVRDALTERGISTGLVHGETPAKERDAIINDFQRMKLRALVNVNVLSEGFDAPHVDCVVMMRPTKSPGLMYQQCGRGLRLSPETGKTDCIVLDFAKNLIEHGPLDQIKISTRRKGDKDVIEVTIAPSKECPQCSAVIPAGLRNCPECGHQFPSAAAIHDAAPAGAPALSTERKNEWHKVSHVLYTAHLGKSGVNTMQVSYRCGLMRYREWICIEHTGFARAKAELWWRRRAPGIPCPTTVEEALKLSSELMTPSSIQVSESGKYPEIINYDFNADPESENDSTTGTAAGAVENIEAPHPVQSMRLFPARELFGVSGRRAG